MRETPLILSVRREGRFSAALRESGIEVISLDLIVSEPLPDQSELRERLDNSERYDGIFVTSPVAANVLLKEIRSSSWDFAGKVYVLGKRAYEILSKAGFPLVFRESVRTAEELMNHLGDEAFAGKRFLFVRGNRSMRTIPRRLEGKAKLEEVIVYRTEESELEPDIKEKVQGLLDNDSVERVCFFSPSGVESFVRTFERRSREIRAAAIGETTGAAAAEAGFVVDLVSEHPDSDEFALELIEHLRKQ